MATTTTTTTAPAVTSGLLSLEGSYGDFRDEIRNKGYAVVKGAIPRDRAAAYQQKAFDWLTSFGTALDMNDPKTWTAANLPVQTKLNTFENYCVVHEKFMWDVRQEPGVVEPFARIWGTDELLVSFDSLNVTFPGRSDKPPRKPWPHVDQSPLKRGLHCVQGIVNLGQAGPEDGSLMLLPNSVQHYDEFWDSQTDPKDWEAKDWRRFTEKEMEWWTAQKGLKAIKVEAEPGDLILWDSRTVHWGGEPTELSKTIRTVVYASYSPARLALPEALAEKQRVFKAYGATTHWAHDNIFLRPVQAYLPDGTLDPRNRDEPREKPEYTDRLLKLAGMKPY